MGPRKGVSSRRRVGGLAGQAAVYRSGGVSGQGTAGGQGSGGEGRTWLGSGARAAWCNEGGRREVERAPAVHNHLLQTISG